MFNVKINLILHKNKQEKLLKTATRVWKNLWLIITNLFTPYLLKFKFRSSQIKSKYSKKHSVY